MLRSRRAGECAGAAAAGAGEEEEADGAGFERPSSSCNHSVESSVCAAGTGAEKPTNSRSHSSSAESPAGAAGGADAEKPTNSHSHSAESSSSGADGAAAMRQKGEKARARRPDGKKATRPEQEDQKARRQLNEMSLNGNEQNEFLLGPPLVASSERKAAMGQAGRAKPSPAPIPAGGWLFPPPPPLILGFFLGSAGNRPNLEILGSLEIATGRPPPPRPIINVQTPAAEKRKTTRKQKGPEARDLEPGVELFAVVARAMPACSR
jgi:hypothetical protein